MDDARAGAVSHCTTRTSARVLGRLMTTNNDATQSPILTHPVSIRSVDPKTQAHQGGCGSRRGLRVVPAEGGDFTSIGTSIN